MCSPWQGAARLKRVGACLSRLRTAGAECVILSNGVESEIEAALTHTGLREHFTSVLGGKAQQDAGTALGGKPSMLARLVLERAANPPKHVIFVDDDMDNYPPGSHVERCCWSLVSTARGQSHEVSASLVAWPVFPAEGISSASMDRLEALLQPPAESTSSWTGDGRRIAPTLPQSSSAK